jgi:Tol biopolymer transport system component
MRKTWTIVMIVAGCWRMPADDRKAGMLMQAAEAKQTVQGDLKAAIDLYRKAAKEAGTNHALGAKALLGLAACYEKSGEAEAGKVYQQIVSGYPDQREAVAQATARLAALGSAAGAGTRGITMRQLWSPAIDTSGTVSADGRYLSFVDWSTGDLAIRDLLTGKNRRLTDKGPWESRTSEAEDSVISPDGKQVAYMWEDWEGGHHVGDSQIRLINTDGSGDRLLYQEANSTSVYPRAWSPDGKWVAVSARFEDKSARMLLVSASDGSRRVIGTRGGWGLAFSPDGRYLAYSRTPEEGTHSADDIYVIDLKAEGGPKETPVVVNPARDLVLGWTPDGKGILFVSDRTGENAVWLMPVENGKPAAEARLIRSGLGSLSPMGTSARGAYFANMNWLTDVRVAAMDPDTGKVTEPPPAITGQMQGVHASAAWSPDGKEIAYIAPQGKIVIRNVESGSERSIVPQVEISLWAFRRIIWHPDGRSLVAVAVLKGSRKGAYRIDVRSGEATPLLITDLMPTLAISPDGRTLFYQPTPVRVKSHDLETGAEREIYKGQEGMAIFYMAVSRDGRYLVLNLPEHLRIIPTEGGDMREAVQVPQQGREKFWGTDFTPDGRYLVALAVGSDISKYEIWRVSLSDGQAQKTPIPGKYRGVQVHPDGRRLLLSTSVNQPEIWVMENLLSALR